MGLDIGGGMLVGRAIKDLPVDLESIEDVGQYIYDLRLEIFSPWFDAEPEYWTVGYIVQDIELPLDPSSKWYKDLTEVSEKFLKLFGVKPKLIGMQNVW